MPYKISDLSFSDDGESICFIYENDTWKARPSFDGRGGWQVDKGGGFWGRGFGPNIWAAIGSALSSAAYRLEDRRHKDLGLRRRGSDV